MSWLSDKFSKRNLQVLSNPFDARNLGSIQHAFSLGEDLANGGSITGAFHDSLKEDPAGAAAVESTTAVDSKAKYEANRQADVLANKAGMGGGYGDKFRQKQMDTYDPNVSSERDRFGSGAKSAAAAMALYAGGSALLGAGGAGSAGAGEGIGTLAAEGGGADIGAGAAGGGGAVFGGGGGATAGGGSLGAAGDFGAGTYAGDYGGEAGFNPNGLPEGSKYASDFPTQGGSSGFNWTNFMSKGLGAMGNTQGGAAGQANQDQIAHQMRLAEMLRQQKEYDDRTTALMNSHPPQFEGGYQNGNS